MTASSSSSRIVRIGVLEHLVHAARESAGTTQVCLLDDTELASQFFLQTRVTLAVLHVLIALIDNQNLGNVIKTSVLLEAPA